MTFSPILFLRRYPLLRCGVVFKSIKHLAFLTYISSLDSFLMTRKHMYLVQKMIKCPYEQRLPPHRVAFSHCCLLFNILSDSLRHRKTDRNTVSLYSRMMLNILIVLVLLIKRD